MANDMSRTPRLDGVKWKLQRQTDMNGGFGHGFMHATASDILDTMTRKGRYDPVRAAFERGALLAGERPVFRGDRDPFFARNQDVMASSSKVLYCTLQKVPRTQTRIYDIDIELPAWPETKLELGAEWLHKVLTVNGQRATQDRGDLKKNMASASSVTERAGIHLGISDAKEQKVIPHLATKRTNTMVCGNNRQGDASTSLGELISISSLMLESVSSPESAREAAKSLYNLTNQDHPDRCELVRSIRLRLLRHFMRVWIKVSLLASSCN